VNPLLPITLAAALGALCLASCGPDTVSAPTVSSTPAPPTATAAATATAKTTGSPTPPPPTTARIAKRPMWLTCQTALNEPSPRTRARTVEAHPQRV